MGQGTVMGGRARAAGMGEIGEETGWADGETGSSAATEGRAQ